MEGKAVCNEIVIVFRGILVTASNSSRHVPNKIANYPRCVEKQGTRYALTWTKRKDGTRRSRIDHWGLAAINEPWGVSDCHKIRILHSNYFGEGYGLALFSNWRTNRYLFKQEGAIVFDSCKTTHHEEVIQRIQIQCNSFLSKGNLS